MFNVGRRNNQFLYDTQSEAWSESRFLAVIRGAYELVEIAELIKKETNGNVIIQPDKNTIKCIMEIKQGALNFDIKHSITPILGFRKKYMNELKIDLKQLLILWVLVQLTFTVLLYLVLKIMVITQTY